VSCFAGVRGSLARVCICPTGWPHQSALSIPLSSSTWSRLLLHYNPRGLGRHTSLGSSKGTRAALSWSTCCTRRSSGTKRETPRTSQLRHTWEASECAWISYAREYCFQTRKTSSRSARGDGSIILLDRQRRRRAGSLLVIG